MVPLRGLKLVNLGQIREIMDPGRSDLVNLGQNGPESLESVAIVHERGSEGVQKGPKMGSIWEALSEGTLRGLGMPQKGYWIQGCPGWGQIWGRFWGWGGRVSIIRPSRARVIGLSIRCIGYLGVPNIGPIRARAKGPTDPIIHYIQA